MYILRVWSYRRCPHAIPAPVLWRIEKWMRALKVEEPLHRKKQGETVTCGRKTRGKSYKGVKKSAETKNLKKPDKDKPAEPVELAQRTGTSGT